jgi:type II pantothenate kinase
MFEVVSTGSDIPLLDLSSVSDEFNDAAEEVDLVVLEGMGRAIETNYNAEFVCDSLRLALIKSEHVAERLGGKTFDCVCKYVPVDDVEDEDEEGAEGIEVTSE